MKIVTMGGGDKIEKRKEREEKDGDLRRKKKEELFAYRKSMQKIIRKIVIEKQYKK